MEFELNSNITKIILKKASEEEYNTLKNWLTPFVHNYRFMKAYKMKKWDGRINYFNNGIIDFGLWNECYKCCKENNFSFIVRNKQLFPKDDNIKIEDIKNFCDDFFRNHKLNGEQFYPYEHQIEAAYKILKYRYGCIEVATSGGKSLIFSIVLFYLLTRNPQYKTLLIVPSITLVSQFYDEILKYNYGFNNENNRPLDLNLIEIMHDNPRIFNKDKSPNIYIGTYQSLSKINNNEFFKQFDIVFVDEAHMAKASTLLYILRKTFGYAKYRIGMSGTYPPEDKAEWLAIASVTGPKIFNIKAKVLMDKGLISNVKIKCFVLNYDDYDFAKHISYIKYNQDAKKAYELEKEYTQNSYKRREFLFKLISRFKHNSLVLFYNIDFGKELYDFLKSNIINMNFYYIDGEVSNEKREYIISQMEIIDDNKPKILVASFGTLSTGVSIKSIKNVVFVDSFKSSRIILQSIGRALRLHKSKNNNAVIYDISDRFHKKYKNILYNHFLIRLNDLYKKEDYPYEIMDIKI